MKESKTIMLPIGFAKSHLPRTIKFLSLQRSLFLLLSRNAGEKHCVTTLKTAAQETTESFVLAFTVENLISDQLPCVAAVNAEGTGKRWWGKEGRLPLSCPLLFLPLIFLSSFLFPAPPFSKLRRLPISRP